MLSEFLLQFKNDISFFNLFEYLTFKSAISESLQDRSDGCRAGQTEEIKEIEEPVSVAN